MIKLWIIVVAVCSSYDSSHGYFNCRPSVATSQTFVSEKQCKEYLRTMDVKISNVVCDRIEVPAIPVGEPKTETHLCFSNFPEINGHYYDCEVVKP